MSCEEYRRHELGELDEATFTAHARACAECQRLLAQDAALMSLAGSLREPVEAPFLWQRIESALREEDSGPRQSWLVRHRTALYRVAAVLVVGAGLGTLLVARREPQPEPRLLTRVALARVEEREQEYVEAIEELEQVASEQLPRLDMDLMLLYRDKMETIDAQIVRCQEALARNPANTHVRRYLLLALQDKKQTLQEIVGQRQAL